ncbi:hypothetical protein AB0958_21460 [Streptomyces sp. NPDC006655]|uniref:hypothetical protein n=1 Tax=Streptomyces sp. NPDC006655 TaxID=3156898 RepID=UPI003452D304
MTLTPSRADAAPAHGIGARCTAVRRHVVERVGALVDMAVREAAVHVVRPHPVQTQGRA